MSTQLFLPEFHNLQAKNSRNQRISAIHNIRHNSCNQHYTIVHGCASRLPRKTHQDRNRRTIVLYSNLWFQQSQRAMTLCQFGAMSTIQHSTMTPCGMEKFTGLFFYNSGNIIYISQCNSHYQEKGLTIASTHHASTVGPVEFCDAVTLTQ